MHDGVAAIAIDAPVSLGVVEWYPSVAGTAT